MPDRVTEIFVFYKDGVPVHFHRDRKVFESWMTNQAWMYPHSRCEIERFVPAISVRTQQGQG